MAEKDVYIDAAYQRLMALSEDERKKLEYDNRMKAMWDRNTLIQMGVDEGIRALVEVCQELEVPRETVVCKIREKFSVSEPEAKAYVKEFWK